MIMPDATTPPGAPDPVIPQEPAAPLVEVSDLVKHFPIKGGILQRQVGTVQAVDGVISSSVGARPSASSASPAAARRPSGG